MADALKISIIITLIALLIFGGLKGRLLGSPVIRSALQTMLIGGLAAGVAFTLARLLSGHA